MDGGAALPPLIWSKYYAMYTEVKTGIRSFP